MLKKSDRLSIKDEESLFIYYDEEQFFYKFMGK